MDEQSLKNKKILLHQILSSPTVFKFSTFFKISEYNLELILNSYIVGTKKILQHFF